MTRDPVSRQAGDIKPWTAYDIAPARNWINTHWSCCPTSWRISIFAAAKFLNRFIRSWDKLRMTWNEGLWFLI